ncbi:hypothetical protein B842_03435 [Corynebacterium humireducens NBRC 106098 = DSM 45392]|uniref:Uncharacterized protein n=1 Tax=Corynebacterium humireducens NBRC 106098 = DSM 45392 TaxID=1223515 RepID=A0A0B5D137_9CORY|nr:hypothetical protein [Corynebacterium humireducens]AJE32540.1 hypothetical protein B842_03435 [Corynebacterium humireducens NBRC 106098 = DSM 45392]
MTDTQPITYYTPNRRITALDRQIAMYLSVETGRPVTVKTRPRKRWKFWARPDTTHPTLAEALQEALAP